MTVFEALGANLITCKIYKKSFFIDRNRKEKKTIETVVCVP